MALRFSQRKGFRPASKLAQRDGMDADLRATLWNLLTLDYWNNFVGRDEYTYRSDEVAGSNLEPLIFAIWHFYFKEPLDTIERYWVNCLRQLRDYFFNAKWFEVYDFVEFIAEYGSSTMKDKFIETCNHNLEAENSAYRFVNGMITEITSQEEINEVESALAKADPFPGVAIHLSSALSLMSQRTNPDYRNSIKESISAVESLAKHIAKDATASLGAVLKKLEASKKLHPALKSAFTSLYGYTSDGHGIRHALMDESNLTKADARFMLICCSAFINYAVDTLETK